MDVGGGIVTSPRADPDTSLLDLILGPPGGGAFLTTPGDETHNRPGYAIAYPNTVEGRAHYMADARIHQANGRNNFLSSVVWDGSVVSDDDLRLTKQTPALYYPTLWADVDNPQELDKARRGALEKRGHVRTRSGTPGRFHLRLPLDEPITDPAEFERLNLQLADALGGVDAAKSYPYMWLTTPGFTRFKPEYPRGKTVMMTSMSDGARWSANELRDLFASWGVEARAARTYTGDASIEPEAIDWDAVPESVRQNYSMIPLEDDRSEAIWHWWLWCKKRHLSVGQTYYISTALDPEGHITSKYESDQSIASQISRAYEKAPPISKTKTSPTAQVDKGKETGMAPSHDDHNNEDPYVPDNVRLRRLDEMEEKIFEPIGVGLFEGAVTVLVGDEESAKTTLVLHVLAALATGNGWEPWGIPSGEPRRVVLIATEPNMIKTRLKLLGVPSDSPHLRVFTDEIGADFPTFPNDAYTDAMLEFAPDFVAIDMWADSVEKLNLKDPQEALAAMKTWVKFATATDSAVLLLAHTNRNNGNAMKARDVYGLTIALRKSARATLLSFIHPIDGMLYSGVEKINMQHPGNSHRFKIASVDTGRVTRRGEPITVAQLEYVDTLPSRVWDLYRESQQTKKDDTDNTKMTTAKALVQVLERGRTPRPQAIIETNAVLAEHGCAAVTPRSVDNAWQGIVDDGQAGQARRNTKREKLWSLTYADHDRDDDDCNDD